MVVVVGPGGQEGQGGARGWTTTLTFFCLSIFVSAGRSGRVPAAPNLLCPGIAAMARTAGRLSDRRSDETLGREVSCVGGWSRNARVSGRGVRGEAVVSCCVAVPVLTVTVTYRTQARCEGGIEVMARTRGCKGTMQIW